MSIYKHLDIDNKKINYGKPEKQGLIYYAPINYNNEPFYLQTPKMICKSDGNEIIIKKNSVLDLETLNTDFSFYDFLLNFDEKNIKETFKNNQGWFNKDIPLEIIDDMYKRICKPAKKDSKPIFSFKVPVQKEKVQCQIYDQKKTCVEVGKLTEGTEIICIIHIKGLKFLKQHYYCDCYISQIKVFLDKVNKFSILDSYSFDDKEEEEEELKELDKDLRLNEEFIQSLQIEEKEKKKKEEEKLKLKSKLEAEKKKYEEQKNFISSIENKLSEL